MQYTTIGLAVALTVYLVTPASAESCSECQMRARTAAGACIARLPPEVRPKDPKKPTDAERKAAADRAAKSKECSTKASTDLANCKLTAKCP